jgi:CBS domain containing-hemolysin-like protein
MLIKIRGGISIVFTFCITIILLFNILFAESAYAYIDPNTGGFFFQTVAPFVYGILGVIVVFWKRISGFFVRMIGRKKDQPNYPSQDD